MMSDLEHVVSHHTEVDRAVLHIESFAFIVFFLHFLRKIIDVYSAW